jgi:hypothetical protein
MGKSCVFYRTETFGQSDNCNPGDSSKPEIGVKFIVPDGTNFYVFTWLGDQAKFSSYMYSTDPDKEILECNGYKFEYLLQEVCCIDGEIKKTSKK